MPQRRSSSIREEESQWISVEDRRKRRVAFEERAKRMLGYLEDSEDLKVGISELKEHLETLEETGFSVMQMAKQARNEKGQQIFDIFRQGEERRCVLPVWRDGTRNWRVWRNWRCQGMMQEVKLLSERQEVLKGM